MKNHFNPRRLTIAQQQLRMNSLHPQFTAKNLARNIVSWTGLIQPTNISETYAIKIVYEFYKKPRIDVLSPKLELVAGAEELPHVYQEDNLCLYYPHRGEWHSGKFIADWIVPWTSLWLMYYETWLATGKWLGGGIEHGMRGNN